ncbi:transketolase [Risungbinella massiliensis]|uniref:transketolase n=1 Tax=Risungbinella massiliensis TaxID=1329796 RepID=UPI0005CBE3EB|nr:transketolase [Risungbinella massiliensis]
MKIDQKMVNTLRVLSIDQIEKAKSGHPGLPMGAAPMAYTVWAKHLKHNPQNPNWMNRDRFVLSAGHGSALLYSLLHLFGYDLSIEDLKQFRQWDSKTPGHPEYGHTVGVEATTGPLGQGISNAVGMAMAETHLAATYNRDGYPIMDHFTYVLCSDGDLMEGVSAEAASLAGHLKLGKLICLYDSNDISLDGELAHSFTENTLQRFESYGWQVIKVEDGNDIEAIHQAMEEAKKETARPTMIEVRTVIGYGSPNRAGSSEAHGKPLGAEESKLTRQSYEWEHEEDFHVPEEVQQESKRLVEAGKQAEAQWNQLWASYQEKYPQEAKSLEDAFAGVLPAGWEESLPTYQPTDKAIATRVASGNALQALTKSVPSLFGGSADLASSNNTEMKGAGVYHAEDYAGRNVWFGVREHGMGAALNGMMYHGGVKAFGATFLVFSDYLRPSIRLAAISKLPAIYVFTHDSVAVGEDGPTHEPVEQIPSLRLIPGLKVLRPADANETSAAWAYALSQTEHPSALILTRQNLPILPGTVGIDKETIAKGAYIVSPEKSRLDGILIATGSEVSLAVAAQAELEKEGIDVRVVSMPSVENFQAQDASYQEEILPSHITTRVALEATHPAGWYRYVGTKGEVIGIDRFGASAPGDLVMKEYGFHVENVVATLKRVKQK